MKRWDSWRSSQVGIGGSRANTFCFIPRSGKDRTTDLDVRSSDKVRFAYDSDIRSFLDVMAHMTNTKEGALFQHDGDFVLFVGVQKHLFTSHDFAF